MKFVSRKRTGDDSGVHVGERPDDPIARLESCIDEKPVRFLWQSENRERSVHILRPNGLIAGRGHIANRSGGPMVAGDTVGNLVLLI